MFFSRSICRLRSLCRAFSSSAESRCFSNSMFVCLSRSRAGKKALNLSFTTIRPPFFRKYCNAMQCNAIIYIYDSVYMPGTRVVFSILYMTGTLRSDVCKGSSECAISSVSMACVFLVLKSEFKPCFGSYFFQDQFLFFSKIFSCFFIFR